MKLNQTASWKSMLCQCLLFLCEVKVFRKYLRQEANDFYLICSQIMLLKNCKNSHNIFLNKQEY